MNSVMARMRMMKPTIMMPMMTMMTMMTLYTTGKWMQSKMPLSITAAVKKEKGDLLSYLDDRPRSLHQMKSSHVSIRESKN